MKLYFFFILGSILSLKPWFYSENELHYFLLNIRYKFSKVTYLPSRVDQPTLYLESAWESAQKPRLCPSNWPASFKSLLGNCCFLQNWKHCPSWAWVAYFSLRQYSVQSKTSPSEGEEHEWRQRNNYLAWKDQIEDIFSYLYYQEFFFLNL